MFKSMKALAIFAEHHPDPVNFAQLQDEMNERQRKSLLSRVAIQPLETKDTVDLIYRVIQLGYVEELDPVSFQLTELGIAKATVKNLGHFGTQQGLQEQ